MYGDLMYVILICVDSLSSFEQYFDHTYIYSSIRDCYWLNFFLAFDYQYSKAWFMWNS